MKLADKIVFLSEEYNQEVKELMPAAYRSKKVSIIPTALTSLYILPELNKTLAPFCWECKADWWPLKITKPC